MTLRWAQLVRGVNNTKVEGLIPVQAIHLRVDPWVPSNSEKTVILWYSSVFNLNINLSP